MGLGVAAGLEDEVMQWCCLAALVFDEESWFSV